MRTNRRQLARTAGLLAAMVIAAGCGVGPPVPGSQATLCGINHGITFATGKLAISGYLPRLIRQWNTAHPREPVTLIPLPNETDDQHAQLAANLQTKSTCYDVMSLDVIWTAEFAANGWIVPLSPKLFPLRDFLQPAVATARYQGRLYAVP